MLLRFVNKTEANSHQVNKEQREKCEEYREKREKNKKTNENKTADAICAPRSFRPLVALSRWWWRRRMCASCEINCVQSALRRFHSFYPSIVVGSVLIEVNLIHIRMKFKLELNWCMKLKLAARWLWRCTFNLSSRIRRPFFLCRQFRVR